jgi:hypothetical protein
MPKDDPDGLLAVECGSNPAATDKAWNKSFMAKLSAVGANQAV